MKAFLKRAAYTVSTKKLFDIDRLASHINFLADCKRAHEIFIDCTSETKKQFLHEITTESNTKKPDNFSDLFGLDKTKDHSSFDFETIRFKHHERRSHRLDLLTIAETKALMGKLSQSTKSQIFNALKPAAPKLSLFLEKAKANRYTSSHDSNQEEHESTDTLTLL